MGLKVEIKPLRGSDKKTLAKIRSIAKKISFTRLVNYQVSVWLLLWVNDNFYSEGRKYSAKGWAPFKYGGRYKNGFLDDNAKLLEDTGEMRASFKHFYDKEIA